MERYDYTKNGANADDLLSDVERLDVKQAYTTQDDGADDDRRGIGGTQGAYGMVGQLDTPCTQGICRDYFFGP